MKTATMVKGLTLHYDVTSSAKQRRHLLDLRHDKGREPWKENGFLVLPCRRSVSAACEFTPLAPFRSRSRPSTSPAMSTHTSNLPRHGSMSIARFYDWSEQDAVDKEDIVSVSRLYREMAKGPKASSLSRSQSERVQSWPAGGQRLGPSGSKNRMNPGRMFLRDKGVLTKGEREIIEGIYKNRGDLRRDQSGTKSDYVVRSHHDAWLVGKHYRLHKPSSEIPRLPAPSEEDPQDSRTTPASQGTEIPEAEDHSAMTCIMCLNEQKQQQQQQQQQPLSQRHRRSVTSPRINGVLHPVPVKVLDTSKRSQEPAAPPSSPDGISSAAFVMPSSSATPVHPHAKEKPVTPPSDHPEDSSLPGADHKISGRTGSGTHRQDEEEEAEEARNQSEKFNNSHTSPEPGISTKRGRDEVPETGCSSPSQDSDDSRRRLHVYLPKIAPEPTEDELKSCLLQGRPILARERPLSHRDLKPRGQLRLGRPGQKPPVPSDTPQPARKREHVKTSWQYHLTGTKPLALNGESFAENCGSQSPSRNTNTISVLSADMEHWQLLDE